MTPLPPIDEMIRMAKRDQLQDELDRRQAEQLKLKIATMSDEELQKAIDELDHHKEVE